MRIFTSWSGERSKAAALGLKSLLQDLFEDAVQVFVSDHISPGEAWAPRLGTELEQSEFGILCLTQENYQACRTSSMNCHRHRRGLLWHSSSTCVLTMKEHTDW
jgi:hypothetical protein